MLAARDQENLVHAQQAAGAAKPLNQGVRGLAPKTPGNKAPKTPFKIPLNDENAAGGFGVKGTSLMTKGKGNENLRLGGDKADKHAFVTPLGPRIRAPLGQKTTNLKTQFKTPGPVTQGKNAGQAQQPSATARKSRPRVSHAEMTKVQVFGDEDFDEREIDFCPPPVADLPDTHDDMPELDFSMFQGKFSMASIYDYHMNKPDADGLSHLERDRLKDQEEFRTARLKEEAALMRQVDCLPVVCFHEPECEDECTDMAEVRRKAQAKYEKTIADLCKPTLPAQPTLKSKPTTSFTKTLPTRPKSGLATKGVSIPPLKSKAIPPARPVSRAPLASKPPSTSISSRKATPLATNNTARHNAAVAASKTTLGYSKGRRVSEKLHMPLTSESGTTKAANARDMAGQDLEALARKQELEFEALTW